MCASVPSCQWRELLWKMVEEVSLALLPWTQVWEVLASSLAQLEGSLSSSAQHWQCLPPPEQERGCFSSSWRRQLANYRHAYAHTYQHTHIGCGHIFLVPVPRGHRRLVFSCCLVGRVRGGGRSSPPFHCSRPIPAFCFSVSSGSDLGRSLVHWSVRV